MLPYFIVCADPPADRATLVDDLLLQAGPVEAWELDILQRPVQLDANTLLDLTCSGSLDSFGCEEVQS
jgi:hypothetical protein